MMTMMALVFLLLFGAIFFSVWGVAAAMFGNPKLHPVNDLADVRKKLKPDWLRLLVIFFHSTKLEPLQRKLAGAGLSVRPEAYVAMKRCAFMLAILSLYACLSLYLYSGAMTWLLLAFCAVLSGACVLADDWLLGLAKRYRERLMVRDIYRICQQLLYYTGSKMNLHGKLMRCVPVTGVTRQAFTWMLNEWYEDPFKAIETFKYRLGTNEGYDLAELLHTLRLNEHQAYYDLLRARVHDYKEKMELAKDSVMETRSYVLFVLAGVPILNTFRVFIYPWVKEGEKLFQFIQS